MSTSSPPPPEPHAHPVPLAERAPRAATRVLALLLPVAAVIYAVQARAQWFFQDDWVFLVERDTGVDSLLDPYNEHWVAAPIAAYRVLWALFGARRYEPYQALSIGSHLVVVVLLYVVLRRRLTIAPWVAVAATSIVLFTGAGAENVVWGFQITFTGSVAAGLAALLLADHPSPSWPRRLAGLGCALLSLMCSGVGLVMVGVLGLALLVRRGLRAAAVATAPVGLVYLGWHQAFAAGSSDPSSDLGRIVEFAHTGLTHAVRGVGPADWTAWALVGLTLVGLAVVASDGRGSHGPLRHRLAIPAAMFTGAVTFFLLTGSTRAVTNGLAFATRGRYAYVAIVLLIPTIAVAADAVVGRWPMATVPVLVLLVAGIPANVAEIEPRASQVVPPALIMAVAASPALADAPGDRIPFDGIAGSRSITAGWLREQVDEGTMSGTGPFPPDLEAEAVARLTLDLGAPWPEPDAPQCHEVAAEGEQVELTEDRSVAYVGRVRLQVLGEDGGRSKPRVIGALEPRTIATVGAPITVLVVPRPGVWNASLCR